MLHRYWTDRARGELTTALTFEFMRDDLMAERAPEALVALAERALADEHRHVDWCLRWAKFVEPELPAEPELSGTRPFELDGASAHDNRLLRTVFGCCFSETVAVHVLKGSNAAITLPSGTAAEPRTPAGRGAPQSARLGLARRKLIAL